MGLPSASTPAPVMCANARDGDGLGTGEDPVWSSPPPIGLHLDPEGRDVQCCPRGVSLGSFPAAATLRQLVGGQDLERYPTQLVRAGEPEEMEEKLQRWEVRAGFLEERGGGIRAWKGRIQAGWEEYGDRLF